MNTTSLDSANTRTTAETNTNEECEHLSACKTITSCPKRHPRVCKRFTSDRGCWFEDKDCAYHHPDHYKSSLHCELRDKIEHMTLVIKGMALKINKMEIEMKEINSKKNQTSIKSVKVVGKHLNPHWIYLVMFQRSTQATFRRSM